MNLHTDKDAFQVLLSNIHERTGYRKPYVLRECDRIPFEKAMDAIAQIKVMLENNPAWGSVDYQTGSV